MGHCVQTRSDREKERGYHDVVARPAEQDQPLGGRQDKVRLDGARLEHLHTQVQSRVLIYVSTGYGLEYLYMYVPRCSLESGPP